MIWNTSRDSTRIPTKDGSLAVRVDGDPHKAPLLRCQRRGTMDDWDPEFVARLSTTRRVIRFDNLGIGESSGETPNTVQGMAEVVPLLLDALGIGAVDLLAQKAPRAKLLLYPNAGHAFLFQYAEDFCAEVLRFTAGPGAHAPGIRARPQNGRRGRQCAVKQTK